MQMNVGSSIATDYAFRSTLAGDLSDVKTLDDFWNFVLTQETDGSGAVTGESGLMSSLYVKQWYNGQAFQSNETNFVLEYYKLVGGVLFTQTRGVVTNDGCVAQLGRSSYDKFYPDCFIAEPVTSENATFGQYQTALTAEELAMTTEAWRSHPGGTFDAFFGLAEGRTFTLNKVNALKKGLWLDKGTRTVNVKFAAYNGNIGPGMFSFVDLAFSFDLGGIFVGGNHMNVQRCAAPGLAALAGTAWSPAPIQ